jgi:putative transcriptional regulator
MCRRRCLSWCGEAQFAATDEFSIRTVQQWERGVKKPSGPARTLLRAIKTDPEGVAKGAG